MRYFIFNKEEDFLQGGKMNLRCGESGLELSAAGEGRPGIFISAVMDSGEKECQWHRLTSKAEIGENMAVYFYLYGADSKEQADRARELMAGELLSGVQEARVLSRMRPYLKKEFRNPEDVLLWDIKARYLFMALVLWGNSQDSPLIREIRLWFPKKTWTAYLPELYQSLPDSFLERYLAVFQTMYEELEMKIRSAESYLEIGAADEEMLLWLCGWLDMENSHLWPPERLKRFLRAGAGIYAIRGTAAGLLNAVECYTGEKAYLCEQLDGEDKEARLFVPESAVAAPGAYRSLRQIVGELAPAQTEVRITALRPYIRLDRDTYLGINSRIGTYKTAAFNGASMLSLSVAGGRK